VRGYCNGGTRRGILRMGFQNGINERTVLGGGYCEEGTGRGYQEMCGWGCWRDGGIPGKVAGSRRDWGLRWVLGQKLGFPGRSF